MLRHCAVGRAADKAGIIEGCCCRERDGVVSQALTVFVEALVPAPHSGNLIPILTIDFGSVLN